MAMKWHALTKHKIKDMHTFTDLWEVTVGSHVTTITSCGKRHFHMEFQLHKKASSSLGKEKFQDK